MPKGNCLYPVLFFFVSSVYAGADVQPVEDNSGRESLLGIMHSAELGLLAPKNGTSDSYAALLNIEKDLNFNEIAGFFNCATNLGHSFFIEALRRPSASTDSSRVLVRRRNIIKALVENPQLRVELETLLQEAREAEQEIMVLLSNFFKGKTCPELKKLEILKQQQQMFAYNLSKFLLLNPTGRMVGSILNVVGTAGYAFGSGYYVRMAYVLNQANSLDSYSALKLFGKSGYFALVSAVCSYGFYKDYSQAAEKRTKIHALYKFVEIAEKIVEISSQGCFEPEYAVADILKNEKNVSLIRMLKHARYKEKNTTCFAVPLVHSFLYKLYESETAFASIFACIAEFDVYNAIATKIIESRNSTNKFCFAVFGDSHKPSVHSEGLWNVLIPNAVVNNVYESRNIILTGPNAGGKTSTIRAMLQNIILAQAFGIAAAESFELTMFDTIHSYLNVSDDLINGLSLFASEVKRAQDIMQIIKGLPSHKKFFFALDELFTGTAAEDGEICAYEFIKKIAQYPGVQFVYATHFNRLKELGESEGTCANYKVDAPIKGVDGKLVYPYTLSKGASDVCVALDMAQQAGLFN